MHAVSLIASALSGDDDCPELPCDTVKNRCCVTGTVRSCIPRKELFGKSFNGGALLARPSSTYVSVDAYIALKYKWERMSSWICDGNTFRRLSRIEVRDCVLEEWPVVPWAGYATTGYKKHGAMRAPVNSPGKCVWLFEERLVDCSDRKIVRHYWETMNAALHSGIGRSVIESLDCPAHIMRKAGLSAWMEYERWARPRHQSALYAFIAYLLPSQEEIKCASSLSN